MWVLLDVGDDPGMLGSYSSNEDGHHWSQEWLYLLKLKARVLTEKAARGSRFGKSAKRARV